MDLRQNYNAYNELFEVHKQDKKNVRGARLKWNKEVDFYIKAKIYRSVESEPDMVDGTFQTTLHTLVIKTPDRINVEINDKMIQSSTGLTYIVVSISQDLAKSKFKGRYDKFRTCDTYITLRG
ncbi:MAG: hypothetical protein KHZ66_08645 [Lacticaseibacillus rhamnosus]|jgi:hypothetical protein|nr:hypothetical protein [Lacticaseibacillus rhamnosus]